MKILVVNPNSTVSMTEALRTNIEQAGKDENISYFTGPTSSPAQIDGPEAGLLSAHECFPLLADDPTSEFFYPNYDGLLVACFSEHPLTRMLRDHARERGLAVKVTDLLEASIAACIGQKTFAKFSIITSNREWIPVLDESVSSILCTPTARWRGTISTDLEVLDLHRDESWSQIKDVIASFNIAKLDSDAIILGCAGFSGIKSRLEQEFPDVWFVDSVLEGIAYLLRLD